jgi:DNA-directed RNA polymerase specialized sigma24 family protein
MNDKQKILKAKKHGFFGTEIGKFLGISKQAVDQRLTKEDKKMIKEWRKTYIINIFES